MESFEVKIIFFKYGCGVLFVIVGFMIFLFIWIIKVMDNELVSLIRFVVSCW